MSDKAVKETYTVKFSHLRQESQISYHTELGKKDCILSHSDHCSSKQSYKRPIQDFYSLLKV